MPDVPSSPPLPLAVALALRDTIASDGIGACHWKSNGHLAEALVGATDIDLYVHPADAKRFENRLQQLDALKIISQPWARYPGIQDWLLFDAKTNGLLHLHLHHALMTGLKRVKHLRIPWDEALIASIRPASGSNFPIPAAHVEFLILLVRIWAKMPPWRRLAGWRVPSSIMQELEWLASEADSKALSQTMTTLLPGMPQDPVLTLLQKTSIDTRQAVRAGQLLNRALTNSFRMSWSAALLIAAKRNATMALHRAVRPLFPMAQVGKTLPGNGLVVAVIGSDGAGKSTVTDALTKWLRFKIDTHCLYLGTGDSGSGLFDLMRRGIRAIIRLGHKRGDTDKGDRTKPKGFAGKVVALHHLVLASHKLSQMRLARGLSAAGRVVVLDRLPQSQHLGINDGLRLQGGESFGWAARRERAIFDKIAAIPPDLIIRLNITPEAALARKPDHDYAVLARKSTIVSGLAFPGTAMVDIDAAQALNDVLHQTKTAVWSKLREVAR